MERELVEVVSSVGFPILCCMFLMRNNNDTLNFFKTFSSEMNKSLDNNTKVLTELVTILKEDRNNETK